MRALLLLPLPLLALSACSYGNDPRMANAKAPVAPVTLTASGESSAAGIAALARKALSMGEVEAALPLARQAVATEPGNAAARQLLAEVLLASGIADEAEAEFAALLQAAPKDPALKTGRAMALLAMGDAPAARQTLAEVVAANPPLPVLSNAALALALAGDPKTAATALAPVAFAPGASAQLRQNYALALTLSGSRTAAYEVATHDLGPQQGMAQVNAWYAQMDKPLAEQLVALTGLPSQPGAVRRVLAAAAPTPAPTVADATPPAAPVVAANPDPAPIALLPAASPDAAPPAAPKQPELTPKTDVPAEVASHAVSKPQEESPKLEMMPITRDTAPVEPPASTATKPKPPMVIIPARSGKLLTTTVSMANGSTAQAPAAPAVASGKWMVQIAAVSEKLQPSLLSRRLKQQFGALIQSLGPVFTRIAAVENKPVKRVFFGPYADRQAAVAACARVRAKGNGCIVKTQPAPDKTAETKI